MENPRWLQTLVDPGICLSSTRNIPFLCANYKFRQVVSLSLGFGPIMLTTPVRAFLSQKFQQKFGGEFSFALLGTGYPVVRIMQCSYWLGMTHMLSSGARRWGQAHLIHMD